MSQCDGPMKHRSLVVTGLVHHEAGRIPLRLHRTASNMGVGFKCLVCSPKPSGAVSALGPEKYAYRPPQHQKERLVLCDKKIDDSSRSCLL